MRELYLYSDGCWEYQNIKETVRKGMLFFIIKKSGSIFLTIQGQTLNYMNLKSVMFRFEKNTFEHSFRFSINI